MGTKESICEDPTHTGSARHPNLCKDNQGIMWEEAC
jgi:hypothetical protein